MGGALFTAYLDAYGDKNDVAKVMFIEAALDGSVLMRDILAMNVDKYNGYSVLEFATTKGASDAMHRLLSLVPWEVRFGVLYRSLDAAFETALGLSPAFWATVPKEAAMSSILSMSKKESATMRQMPASRASWIS